MKIALILGSLFFCLPTFASKLMPYVYLTFENEDTSRSLTVNFMTPAHSDPSYVYLGTKSGRGNPSNYSSKVLGKTGHIDDLPRTYHHVSLKNLSPNTTYYFIVGDPLIGYSQEFKFRTLPDDDRPIKVLSGGDMGTNKRIIEVSRAAMEEEPDIILIGGDISYANGKTKEIKKWDDWFDLMMEVMISPRGFLTPIIVAIGNHEVTTGVALPWAKAPFYEQLFAQNQGKSFFVRQLGSHTSLIVLDTGHMNSHDSQKEFIEQSLQKAQSREHRLALYHVPLYPNHRSEGDILSSSGRSSWLELFDKYHLTAAFENHDHTLKRTHILRDHQIATKGTVYVGDGCWGKNGRSSNPQRWYLKKADSKTHVWIAEVSSSSIEFKALGLRGEILDNFVLSNSPRKTSVQEL